MSQPRLHVFTDDALGTCDATELAQQLAQGGVSASEVTEAAIARLERAAPLNGLTLAAFDSARQRAKQNAFSGRFAAVPSLIKDNIDIEGLATLHGSAAMGHKPMKKTSALAKQYLAQGFNLLGKSSLPAFGFTASTEMAHSPATRNPWHLAHSAGGSSGGSAALVAAGRPEDQPVALVRVDLHHVAIPLRIRLLELFQPLAPLGCHLVSVIGAILPAHLDREADVPQAQWRGVIRMAGHH